MNKYYENPIRTLRRNQLKSFNSNEGNTSLEEIFNSIPRNIRKIFLYEATFDKAFNKLGMNMEKKMRECLKYCIDVIA